MDVKEVKEPDGQLLELKAVAGRLSISVDTVRRHIEDGALIATNVGTRQRPSYRVDMAEIRRFIKAKQMLTGIKNEASPPREGTPRNSEASASESA